MIRIYCVLWGHIAGPEDDRPEYEPPYTTRCIRCGAQANRLNLYSDRVWLWVPIGLSLAYVAHLGNHLAGVHDPHPFSAVCVLILESLGARL